MASQANHAGSPPSSFLFLPGQARPSLWDFRVRAGWRHELGLVAQLGERVLCKHEVVGSIPSGSTSGASNDEAREPTTILSGKQFADA